MWVWLDTHEFVGGCPFRDSRCRQKLQPFTVTWGQKEWQDKRRSGETTDLNNEAGGVVWGHHVGGLGKLSFFALPGEAWRDNLAVLQTSAVKCTTPLQCQQNCVWGVWEKGYSHRLQRVQKDVCRVGGEQKPRANCMHASCHTFKWDSQMHACAYLRLCEIIYRYPSVCIIYKQRPPVGAVGVASG